LDDLAHAGVLGLFDAVEKYDASKKVAFHLYAKHRIRGAILDSLRQLDWASRDLRKRYKSIEAAAQRQAQKLGRAPAEEEVAEALGVTPGQLRKQKSDLQAAGLNSGQPHRVEPPDYSSYTEASESIDHSPDHIFANRQLRSALDVAVETLPPRYQTVIRLYYDKERTMKQIGAELGVNESRVSQIHKTALQKLASALRANGYANPDVFLSEAARA
jgi:RNA polymerase sigma factor for flagellar operon FliA